MCYAGKCLCIKVETGALIFGIINAIFHGLLSVASVVAIVGINYIDYNRMEVQEARRFSTLNGLIVGNVLFGLLALKSLIEFLFSVILCDGICKKKASYVKAYFTYGMLMALLGGMLVVVMMFADWECALVFLGVLAVYCMILHMVNQAYNKLTSGEIYQFQHKRLSETIY